MSIYYYRVILDFHKIYENGTEKPEIYLTLLFPDCVI